jgi:hypothetical protein
MKLLLKRDETGTGFPSGDQIEVGELVINSKTGKLYSKLKDGTIVEWIGQKICFDPIPDIALYYENMLLSDNNISDFCCLGAILEFEVSKLKPDPAKYTFEFIELTNNSNPTDVEIQVPRYSSYALSTGENARKANVPINLAILNSQQTISIFKFSVIDDSSKKIGEKIITIKCKAS